MPGVARKTANVVLAHAFGINAGVTVDTHVKRLANRLRLTRHSDPKKIEPDLMKLVPRPDWENLSIRLIFHGRAVCVARKTASVVLAWCFGINAGVTMDTHVSRLAQRLQLSRHREPRRIEPDLMKLVAQADWQNLSIRLIFHGLAVCTARKPRCGDCPIADLCPMGSRPSG